MGELSKKIGEDGELLALEFFKRIGWHPLETAIDIVCADPHEHILRGSKGDRSSHGVDLLFSYLCPLMPRTRRNVLISMKNSNYEKTYNRSSLVKDDMLELDWSISCFSRSPKRSDLQMAGGANTIRDSGVLIRLNRDASVARSFVGDDPESLSRQQYANSVHFIENSRFDFVDQCMSYLDKNLRDAKNEFKIHRNSLSFGGDVRVIASPFLPLQSLVAGPIIIRSEDNTNKILVVFSTDVFSDSALKRMIGLALQCSDGWASEVRIVMPGYDRSKAGVVDGIRSQLQDRKFARTIACDSFENRSRLK